MRTFLTLFLMSLLLVGCGKGKSKISIFSKATTTVTPSMTPSPSPTPTPQVFMPILELDAVRMNVAKIEMVSRLDQARFPYIQRYVSKGKPDKIPSPDSKRLLWRGKSAQGYYLYLSDADGKHSKKIKDCKNAYQPSWGPDSAHVLYTSVNWKTGKRNIVIYDLLARKKREVFGSRKGVGAMAAFSPNGSKIAFTYFDELWMMNSDGIGRTNVSLRDRIKVSVKEAALLAWSVDGSQLAYQPLGARDIFIITFVRKG
jgi:hypothetical protein